MVCDLLVTHMFYDNALLGLDQVRASKVSFSEVIIAVTATLSTISSGENAASHPIIHIAGETAMTRTSATPLTKLESVSVKEMVILLLAFRHIRVIDCLASGGLNVAVWWKVSFLLSISLRC